MNVNVHPLHRTGELVDYFRRGRRACKCPIEPSEIASSWTPQSQTPMWEVPLTSTTPAWDPSSGQEDGADSMNPRNNLHSQDNQIVEDNADLPPGGCGSEISHW
jgi:hypothetical protein